jgi:ubiquinone/menaquinone biosynthesis C-methylase UbiE
MIEAIGNRRSAETISMEKHRDLRDYAQINGFYYAKDFEVFLKDKLKKGDTILDLGCGKGKAIAQIGRELYPKGIEVLALDWILPEKKYDFVKYLDTSFEDTRLNNNSVEMILSVFGFLTYAESEKNLRKHIRETKRILAPNGTISAIVDPVIISKDREILKDTEFNGKSYFDLLSEEKKLRETIVALSRSKEKEQKEKNEKQKQIAWSMLDRTKLAKQMIDWERDSQRSKTDEIRIQSPTDPGKYFKVNIFKLLKDEGLTVVQKIMPKGGKMVDDEITLIITKSKSFGSIATNHLLF